MYQIETCFNIIILFGKKSKAWLQINLDSSLSYCLVALFLDFPPTINYGVLSLPCHTSLNHHIDSKLKVMHHKYYKHLAYALAHKMSLVCFSLFWPSTLKAKIDNFFVFTFFNNLVWILKYTLFFCISFDHEIMKMTARKLQQFQYCPDDPNFQKTKTRQL